MANAATDDDELCFQIGEDEMYKQQIAFGNLCVTALGYGKVLTSALVEVSISTPTVISLKPTRKNEILHKSTMRNGAVADYCGEPDTPSMAHVLAFATSSGTNPCLTYLYISLSLPPIRFRLVYTMPLQTL